MKCPVDNSDLVMTDRQGIEIDYCPQCRGVWLDRGELDKIIERSDMGGAMQPRYADDRRDERSRDRYDDDDDDRYEDRRRGDYRDSDSGHRKHKKEGFMSDLFDF